MRVFKIVLFISLILPLGFINGCSTNPATGESQFTALLPAEREAAVGLEEHRKVQQTFGDFIQGPIAAYVNEVGQEIAVHTERKDVQYKFYVIDSSMVNAFAIPGGYIYLTRGLIALANNEAEMAAVIAHEIGHITGRHSAERVSQGFLTSLGSAILGAVVDAPGIGQAANVGSELYIKSYSRGQENQADELGVRYLHRAGYDPFAMASFLASLERDTELQSKISGRSKPRFSYFSTHPQTDERVALASSEATRYPQGPDKKNRNRYLNVISGLVYGDSAKQGFIRGTTFYHTEIGFKFSVPNGFTLVNNPREVVATNSSGAVILFDSARSQDATDPMTYMTQQWMRSETLSNAEALTINSMRAATAGFSGTVNGRASIIRIVAIEWAPGQFFRFQMAIPKNSSNALVEELKRTTYSFAKLSGAEKNRIKPYRIQVVTANAGESVSSLASRFPFPTHKEDRFRVLNGLKPGQNIVSGQQYKIIVE